MQNLAWIFLYCVIFLGPGFLMGRLLGMRRHVFIFSLAFSHSLAVLTLMMASWFRLSPTAFGFVMTAEIGVFALFAAARLLVERNKNHNGFSWKAALRRSKAELFVGLMLLVLILTYSVYSGPYMEIPADVYVHLTCVHNQFDNMTAGALPEKAEALRHFFSQSFWWYFLPAWLCRIAGLTVDKSIGVLASINSGVFVLGVYSFGLFLFAKLRISRKSKAFMAAASAIFCAVHLGTGPFAYIRYYAFAPTMLNFIVYLAFSALYLDYLRCNKWLSHTLWILPMFLLTINVVHTQEALFAFFTALASTLAIAASDAGRGMRNAGNAKPFIALSGLLIVFCAVFYILRGHPITSQDPLFVVPIQNIVPFLRNMFIQPPAGQFYEVITLWGVWVYFLFFLTWRKFANIPFIQGGMMLPLLTVFNPITVDILLRFQNSPPAIYRLNYILPIHFVAGMLFVTSFRALLGYGALPRRNLSQKCVCAARNIIVIGGLILFLFPINTRYLYAPHSRVSTLIRTPADNTPKIWSDMLEYLASLKHVNSRIITDPITAYVAAGITGVNCENFKFYWTYRMDWLKETDAHALRQLFAGLDPNFRWFLVINQRDGAISHVGAKSLHWPAEVLRVSQYYSSDFIEFLRENPVKFDKIWAQDRIEIYRIKDN